MKCNQLSHHLTRLGLFIGLIIPFLMCVSSQAFAAQLTNAVMRLDNMRPNGSDDVLVAIKTTDRTPDITESSFKIIFDKNFVVDTTNTNITVSTVGVATTTVGGATLTAWPGIGAAATTVAANQACPSDGTLSCTIVTFASGDLVEGTFYGFFITGGITNPPAVGQHTHSFITADADSDEDTGRVATRIIADNQVVINAVVPPTFSFSLNRNTTTFVDNANIDNDGVVPAVDLDPTTVLTTQRVRATAGTNARNGWSAWLRSTSATPRLYSSTTSEAINSAGSVDAACSTITAGQDYYQLAVLVHTDESPLAGPAQDLTIPAEYNCTHTDGGGVLDNGGTFSNTYQQIAYASNKTNGDIISIYARASVLATKTAGTDYTDTWEIVGAANF